MMYEGTYTYVSFKSHTRLAVEALNTNQSITQSMIIHLNARYVVQSKTNLQVEPPSFDSTQGLRYAPMMATDHYSPLCAQCTALTSLW